MPQMIRHIAAIFALLLLVPRTPVQELSSRWRRCSRGVLGQRSQQMEGMEDDFWWRGQLKIYAGVVGNETVMLRKMRIDSYTGCLDPFGFAEIDPGPQVINTPMLIRTYPELDHGWQRWRWFEERIEDNDMLFFHGAMRVGLTYLHESHSRIPMMWAR